MDRQDTSFRSADADCAAWLYRPDGSGEEQAPCVVMAHGFSAVREQRLPAYAERFAEAGMAVLLFDHRHFGASGGEPRQLLDVGHQLADWRAAVAFARTLDGIDAGRIALFGTSFSGGHALAIAAEDHRVAAVISQCPMTDGLLASLKIKPATMVRLARAGLRDQLGALAGRSPHTVPAAGHPGEVAVMTAPDVMPGFAALDPPGSNWRNAVAARIALKVGLYRPGRKAAQITCPVLACICDHDTLVSTRAAVKVTEAAPRGQAEHYACGHFDIYVGEWFDRAIADQTAFLREHLLTATPAIHAS